MIEKIHAPWQERHRGVTNALGETVMAAVLGSVHRKDPSEDCATARLVAAAPDLYQALEGLLAIVSDSRGVDGYHLFGDTTEWGELDEVSLAVEVLKKARGES